MDKKRDTREYDTGRLNTCKLILITSNSFLVKSCFFVVNLLDFICIRYLSLSLNRNCFEMRNIVLGGGCGCTSVIYLSLSSFRLP